MSLFPPIISPMLRLLLTRDWDPSGVGIPQCSKTPGPLGSFCDGVFTVSRRPHWQPLAAQLAQYPSLWPLAATQRGLPVRTRPPAAARGAGHAQSDSDDEPSAGTLVGACPRCRGSVRPEYQVARRGRSQRLSGIPTSQEPSPCHWHSY